jgi:hypothetical protein
MPALDLAVRDAQPSGTAPRPPLVLFTIAGQLLAANLTWLPPVGTGRQAADAARQEASEHQAAAYAFRPPPEGQQQTQVALAWESDASPFRGTATAAAAVVANIIAGTFVAAWRISTPDGDMWWVVACAESVLYPYGDRAFSTEDDARSHAAQCLSGLGGMHRRIMVPASWSSNPAFADNRCVDLTATLAPHLTPWRRWQSTYPRVFALRYDYRATMAKTTRAIVLPLVCIGLWWVYAPRVTSWWTTTEPPASTPPAGPPVALPTSVAALPSAWIDECQRTLDRLVLPILGWQTGDIGCERLEPAGGRATVAYLRTDGALASLLSAFPPPSPHPEIANDGKSAVISVPLDMSAVRQRPPGPLLSPDDAKTRVLALGDTYHVRVSQLRVLPADPGRLFPQIIFELAFPDPPAEWGPVLDAFPGAALAKLHITFPPIVSLSSGPSPSPQNTSAATADWSMEGLVYAARP